MFGGYLSLVTNFTVVSSARLEHIVLRTGGTLY